MTCLNGFQAEIELTIVAAYVLVPLFLCTQSLFYSIEFFCLLCSESPGYFWFLCVFLIDCFLRQDLAL